MTAAGGSAASPTPAIGTVAPSTNEPASSPRSQDSQKSGPSPSIGGIIASVLGMTTSTVREEPSTHDVPAASSQPQNGESSVLSILSAAQTTQPAPTHPGNNDPTVAAESTQPTQADPGNNDPTAAEPTQPAPVSSDATAAAKTTQPGQADPENTNPTAAEITQAAPGNNDRTTAGQLGTTYTDESDNPQTVGADPSNVAPAPEKATVAVVTAGDSTFIASRLASGNGALVNGQTLSQNQVTTIGSQVVSVGASEVAVDGSDVATFSQVTQPAGNAVTAPVASEAAYTLDGTTFTAGQGNSGGFAVADSTLSQDAQVTISGHTYSAGSGRLVVDGTTVAATAQAIPQATFTVNGATLTAAQGSNGAFVVAGSTLAQGAQATISDHTYSAGPGGLIVDGTTVVATAAQTVPQATFTAIQASNGGFVVAGSTLSQGAQATISDHTYSAGSGGLIVDGTTVVASAAQTAPETTFMVDGAMFTASQVNNGGFVVAGSTISPGALVTVSGPTFSAGASGLAVDATTTLAVPQAAQVTDAVLTTDGATYTVLKAPNNGFIIAGTTVSQGAQITISGHTFSAGPSVVAVDGATTVTVTQVAQATGAVLITDGNTYTVLEGSNNGLIVAGSTLSEGSQVTISGHTFSAGPSGVVVDATDTVQFSQLPSDIAVAPASGAVVTVGANTYTVAALSGGSAGAVTFASHTLSVGGPAITVDGTLVSDGSSGLVLGSRTVPLSRLSTGSPTGSDPSSAPAATVGASGSSTKIASAATDVRASSSVALLALVGLCVYMA